MLTPLATERRPPSRTRVLRTIIVVGRPGQQLPDSAFDAVDYDIVVLEPLARAYTQIKRVKPTLIIMSLSLDDHEGYQLLSMLKLDPETASIPIRIHAAPATDEASEETQTLDTAEDFATLTLPMN